MDISFYKEDKLLVIKIKEEMDEYMIQNLRRRVDYEIQRYMPKKTIFDFDSVTFMDSAGIGFLLGRYKLINILGGEIQIANLNDSLKRIFEMSGILRIISITTLEENIA